MTTKSYNRSRYILAFLALCMMGTVGIYIGYFYRSTGIYTYNSILDRSFILDCFKQDWHWLVSEYSVDFSPEYMLDTRSSSKRLEHQNNLTTKMYYDHGKPVGFIAYYEKPLFEGFILFLDIAKEYRSKGYARALMQAAIADLKKRGMRQIQLITREINLPAQTLYTSLGFVDFGHINGFVRFKKDVSSDAA